MGIAPLAIAELFCCSPQRRREMEVKLSEHLAQVPHAALPPPDAEFLAAVMIEGKLPDPVWVEAASRRLQAQFLTTREDSCYSHLSVFSRSKAAPTEEDWGLAEKLGVELIDKGLCHSVFLRQGCESKGFFGKRVSSAIIASPDFAKLAALKWFDQLDASGLPAVADKLDSKAAHARYCENAWKALMVECKADPRFASVLAKSAR